MDEVKSSTGALLLSHLRAHEGVCTHARMHIYVYIYIYIYIYTASVGLAAGWLITQGRVSGVED